MTDVPSHSFWEDWESELAAAHACSPTDCSKLAGAMLPLTWEYPDYSCGLSNSKAENLPEMRSASPAATHSSWAYTPVCQEHRQCTESLVGTPAMAERRGEVPPFRLDTTSQDPKGDDKLYFMPVPKPNAKRDDPEWLQWRYDPEVTPGLV